MQDAKNRQKIAICAPSYNFVWLYLRNLRKYSFSAGIVNIWKSLSNTVVDVDTVCLFKARLDKFWMHQVVKYDFTADLVGIGNRSIHDISVL